MNRIKEIRKSKGIRQYELAERIGCRYQEISRWERGKSEPSLYYLRRLKKALGVSIDEIAGEEEK